MGTGQAQRVWERFAGSGAASVDVETTSASPGASSTGLRVAILRAPRVVNVDPPPPIVSAGDGVKVSTFLGDETRRLYGLGPPPKHLDLIWRTSIGSGRTSRVGARAEHPVVGHRLDGPAGDPARQRQALSRGRRLRPQLHKIELGSGRVVWEYAYDDIIKSSPTVIEDPHPRRRGRQVPRARRLAARLAVGLHRPDLAPYRAVSFGTGKEVWRLPVPLTASYSRDVDGSGFFLNGRLYSGVESGWFYKLDPFKTSSSGSYHTPKILAQQLLLGDPGDASAHGGNLVLEASPSLLGDTIYISSGAGHVYGMRKERPQGRVGLPHRLGPRRHAGAHERGQAPRGRGEAVHRGPRRRADARPEEDRVEGRRVVLPHRRPHAGRLAGRHHRVGGRQRRLRPEGPPPPPRGVHRHRRQPLRGRPGRPGRRHGARPEPRRARTTRRS